MKEFCRRAFYYFFLGLLFGVIPTILIATLNSALAAHPNPSSDFFVGGFLSLVLGLSATCCYCTYRCCCTVKDYLICADSRDDIESNYTHRATNSNIPIHTSNNIYHLISSNTNEFSESLNKYLVTFNDKEKSYSEQAADLQIDLDQLQKPLREQIICPISADLMDKPVTLDGKVYDLDSLLRIPVKNGCRKNPYTNLVFTEREISPARDAREKIEALIKNARANKKQQVPELTVVSDDENDDSMIPLRRFA
jgi:hypothetical protein